MDTDTLRYLIMKYQPCGKRNQGRPLKDFSAMNGTEQATRLKTLPSIWRFWK